MENIILQTDNLTKKFGSFTALDNINISLYENHIYGFIGENGAGKTTLMRIITGLLYQTEGSFSLFGKTEYPQLEKMRKYIGSTIEAPALYPYYTAFQNLELQRILIGNPDKNICDELLKLMDLYSIRDKKVYKLSMGIKQRLSICLALIGKPRLLILDEPINSLDPKNIASLRNTLKKLNEEMNTTIFISSHILNELYLLATDYIIINKGKIIDIMTHNELETKCRKYIRIKTDNLPICLTVLDNELHTSDYKAVSENMVYLYSYTDNIEMVSTALMKKNIVITELSLAEQNLEEYFLSVTGGDKND
ncbi:MAG: ABC transporter ATP-binding protein [Lachnospiraceae bacterium]|nr:ABC transporter ATP-binding protein [Lachnospiraceae bacterium]